jgi:hypothetical protein
MKWLYTPSDRMLVAAALVPVFAIVTYGVIVASSADSSQSEQAGLIAGLLDPDFVLKSADPEKAIFRTRRGLVTVTPGSTLGPFGQVLSIAIENGHWTVRTVKGATFVRN